MRFSVICYTHLVSSCCGQNLQPSGSGQVCELLSGHLGSHGQCWAIFAQFNFICFYAVWATVSWQSVKGFSLPLFQASQVVFLLACCLCVYQLQFQIALDCSSSWHKCISLCSVSKGCHWTTYSCQHWRLNHFSHLHVCDKFQSVFRIWHILSVKMSKKLMSCWFDSERVNQFKVWRKDLCAKLPQTANPDLPCEDNSTSVRDFIVTHYVC